MTHRRLTQQRLHWFFLEKSASSNEIKGKMAGI
jgi:hypothetical protein